MLKLEDSQELLVFSGMHTPKALTVAAKTDWN